jgi:Leucine-rich repeat (LRR) protein
MTTFDLTAVSRSSNPPSSASTKDNPPPPGPFIRFPRIVSANLFSSLITDCSPWQLRQVCKEFKLSVDTTLAFLWNKQFDLIPPCLLDRFRFLPTEINGFLRYRNLTCSFKNDGANVKPLDTKCLLLTAEHFSSLQNQLDQSLVTIWKKVRENNPTLNLPELKEEAQTIRDWLKENPNQVATITQLTITNDHSLSCIPPEIGYFKGLEQLDVSNSKIQFLSGAISQLENLKYLNLDGNTLQTLPENIGELKKLEYLFLSHNPITALPSSISKLKKLKELDLTKNQLNSFPSSLCQLTNLQKLKLVSNRLAQLPNEINQFQNLTHLDLSHNQLTEFPLTMGGLAKLEVLSISSNRFSELSSNIFQLPQLQRLELYINDFTTFPETIKGFHGTLVFSQSQRPLLAKYLNNATLDQAPNYEDLPGLFSLHL